VKMCDPEYDYLAGFCAQESDAASYEIFPAGHQQGLVKVWNISRTIRCIPFACSKTSPPAAESQAGRSLDASSCSKSSLLEDEFCFELVAV
jgi:hypothetical protein